MMKTSKSVRVLTRVAVLVVAVVVLMSMATTVMADDYAPYSAGPHIAVSPPDDPSAAPYAPYTAGPVVSENDAYAPYSAGPHIPVSPPDAP